MKQQISTTVVTIDLQFLPEITQQQDCGYDVSGQPVAGGAMQPQGQVFTRGAEWQLK